MDENPKKKTFGKEIETERGKRDSSGRGFETSLLYFLDRRLRPGIRINTALWKREAATNPAEKEEAGD